MAGDRFYYQENMGGPATTLPPPSPLPFSLGKSNMAGQRSGASRHPRSCCDRPFLIPHKRTGAQLIFPPSLGRHLGKTLQDVLATIPLSLRSLRWMGQGREGHTRGHERAAPGQLRRAGPGPAVAGTGDGLGAHTVCACAPAVSVRAPEVCARCLGVIHSLP